MKKRWFQRAEKLQFVSDRLQSLLRPIVFTMAGPSRPAAEAVHLAGCAVESRSPPWGERQ